MTHTTTLKLAPFVLLSGFIFSGHAVAVEKILPKVENFPFEISVVAPDDAKLASEQYNIKILNKTNHKTQIIEEGKPFKEASASDLLTLKDVNNDGHLDIIAASLYPSQQEVSTIYLFNPQNQTFVNGMDNIPYEGKITTTKPGCIKVEYIVREGSNYLAPAHFCWKNNTWQLVKKK